MNEWRSRAACSNLEPEIFDDPITLGGRMTPDSQLRLGYARAVCARCPVAAACSAYAAEEKVTAMVWAGEVYGLEKAGEKIEGGPGRTPDPAIVTRRIEVARLHSEGWKIRALAEHFGVGRCAIENDLQMIRMRGVPQAVAA